MLRKIAFIALMVLVIIMIFCFVSWSEPNPKQAITQSKNSKLTKQKGSEQITPPPDFITNQQLIDAISHAIETTANKAKATQNPPPPANPPWLFSLLLTIFTGGLVAVGIAQCYIIFKTLRETQKVANAATQAAKVAEDALHISERAYLSIEHIAIEFKLGGFIEARYDIINVGHTPAQIIKTLSNVEVFDDIPETPNYDKGRIGHSEMPIRPGGRHTMAGINSVSVITDQGRIYSGQSTILVWGKIIYCDVFNEQHVFAFGVRYFKDNFVPVDGYNNITDYKAGNKAD